MSTDWILLSQTTVGGDVGFIPAHGKYYRPALKTETPTHWHRVRTVEVCGRSRILTFEDGSTFDAGHAYRLWVRRDK